MPSKELFSGTEPLQLAIKDTLTQSRARTLQLFEGVSEETFRLQANSDFSPVGWHLGHIGFTEGLWLLEHEAGYAPCFQSIGGYLRRMAYLRLSAKTCPPLRKYVPI